VAKPARKNYRTRSSSVGQHANSKPRERDHDQNNNQFPNQHILVCGQKLGVRAAPDQSGQDASNQKPKKYPYHKTFVVT
jgi:hypothetical protein